WGWAIGSSPRSALCVEQLMKQVLNNRPLFQLPSWLRTLLMLGSFNTCLLVCFGMLMGATLTLILTPASACSQCQRIPSITPAYTGFISVYFLLGLIGLYSTCVLLESTLMFS